MTLTEPKYILEDSSDNSNEDEDVSVEEISDNESVEEFDKNNENESTANAGWADSVAKILSTKKPKRKKTLVLSKAKKLSDVKPEKPKEIGFEIEGEVKEEKIDLETTTPKIKLTEPPAKRPRKQKSSLRVKPNILEKDRERILAKIATRGVVQLFNSVRMHQKDVNQKLQEAGPLTSKREKVMKNIDKRTFLNVLMGEKSQPVDGPVKDELKEENENKKESKSTWNVLRDDFMMGAKFKDWDKETELNKKSDSEEEFSSDTD